MDAKKKSPKKARPADQSEFSGRLLSISTGSAGAHWRFDMANKKGEFRSYVLEGGDPTRFTAMTILVTSAYMAGKKLHVRGGPNIGSDRVASEVWVGTKEKALAMAPSKPEKRTTGEPPAAAS
jgi:hypothetical protein